MEKIPLSSQLNNSIISEMSSYIGPVAYKKSYSYYDSSIEYIYELYKIETKQSLNNAEFNNGFKGLEYNITEDTVIYNGKSIEKINSNIGNALKNGVKYDIDVVSYDADNNARALWIKNYSSDSMVEGLPEYFTFNNGNATLEFTPNISGTYQFELIDDAASISLKEKQSQMQMAQSRGYYVENLMCYNLIAGKKYVVDLSSYYSADDKEKVAVISLQREGLSEFEIRGSIGWKKNDLYEVYDWDNDIYYFLKSDIEIDENELDFADGLYSDGYIKVDNNNHISGYEEAPKYIDYNIGYSYGIVQDYYYGSNYNYVKLDTGKNCRNVKFAYSVRINGERYYNYDDMPGLNGVVLYQTNDDGEIYTIFNNDTSLQSELLEYDAKNQTFAGLNYKMTDDTLVFDNEAEWGIPIRWSDYNDGEKYLVTVIACDRYDNARAIVIGGLLPEKLIVNDYGKTEYIQGEMLDLSDLSISCQYQNGSTKDVTEQVIIADIDETTPLKAGNYNYKVSYTENGTTIKTTIAIKVTIPLESISVSGDLAVGSTLVPEVLPENASVYYEWYRSDNNVNWTILSNDASYKLQKEDGNNYIKVVARGINLYSGTVSCITEKISSDNVKPEIQDAFVSKEAPTNEVNISYEYSDNDCLGSGILYVSFDNGETYEQIDEKDYSSNKLSSDKGVFVVDTTKYDDGEITFKITVFDKSGNESEPKYVNYIVDNTAPGTPGNFELNSHYEDITLSWEAVPDSDFEEYRIYKLLDDKYECIATRTSTSYVDYNVDLDNPDKEYFYYVTAIDKRLNEGTATATLKASLAKDVVKPVVQSIQILNEYPGNAIKISSYATDDYDIGKLVLEISTDAGETFTAIDEKSIMPILLLQPISLLGNAGNNKVTSINNTFTIDTTTYADGNVIFRTVAYDKAGNESEPLTKDFVIDNTAPKAPNNFILTPHYEDIVLSWDAAVEEDINEYKVYKEYLNDDLYTEYRLISTQSTLSYTDTDVKENEIYSYYVTCTDKRYNEGEGTVIKSSGVLQDAVKPTVESIEILNEYPGNAIKVQGRAVDDYIIDNIVLEISTDNGNTFTRIGDQSAEGRVTSLTGEITADTTKYPDGDCLFKITAYDKAGNESEPLTKDFVIDNTAPSLPENIRTNSTQDYIELLWDKSFVEKDFSHFNIYRTDSVDGDADGNGVINMADILMCPPTLIKSLNTIGYRDDLSTGVFPDRTYFYFITSVDNRQNESEKTGLVPDIMAKLSTDNTTPEIISYTPYSASKHYKDMPLNLQISAKDNYQLSKIKIAYRLKNTEEWTEITSINTSKKTDVVSYSFDISALATGTYEIKYSAYDHAENKSNDVIVEYLIDDYELPVSPSFSAEGGHRSVSLSWQYGGKEELISYYNVYRKAVGDSGFSHIGRTTAKSHIDKVVPGEYIYKIIAVDIRGTQAASAEVHAQSVIKDEIAPTAYINMQNPLSVPDSDIVFDASHSYDNDAVAGFEWDFGDGQISTERTVTHRYNAPGNYTVTLRVTDESENIGTATINVEIIDVSEESEFELVEITVKGSDGKIINGSTVHIVSSSDTSDEMTGITDSNGKIKTVLKKDNKYKVEAHKENSGYDPKESELDTKDTSDYEIKLDRTLAFKATVTSHEMTAEEIKEAGIDISSASNSYVKH